MFSIFERWTYLGYVLSPTYWQDPDTLEYSGKVTYHLWKLFEKKKSGRRRYELVMSGDHISDMDRKYRSYSPLCTSDKIEVSNWVSGGVLPSNFKDSEVPINKKSVEKSAEVIPLRLVKDDE